MLKAKFEVFQNGARKCCCENGCSYSTKELLQMKAAGCTFKLDGKRYVPKNSDLQNSLKGVK